MSHLMPRAIGTDPSWHGSERRRKAAEAKAPASTGASALEACVSDRAQPATQALAVRQGREKSSRPAPEGAGLDAVPVKARRTGRPPRAKGIYHVGCTDYPDPTYP